MILDDYVSFIQTKAHKTSAHITNEVSTDGDLRHHFVNICWPTNLFLNVIMHDQLIEIVKAYAYFGGIVNFNEFIRTIKVIQKSSYLAT